MTPPTTDTLDSLSDADLNEVVAAEVARLTPVYLLMKRGLYYRPKAAGYTASREEAGGFTEQEARNECSSTSGEVTMHLLPAPSFATDANAVFPLLEKHQWRGQCLGMSGSTNGWPHYLIWVTETPQADHPERFGREHEAYCCRGDSLMRAFARAACLALVRATRAASST